MNYLSIGLEDVSTSLTGRFIRFLLSSHRPVMEVNQGNIPGFYLTNISRPPKLLIGSIIKKPGALESECEIK